MVASAGDLIARRYRLLRELGFGGMGVVWSATDEHHDRTVALKHVRLDRFAPGEPSDQARELLRGEAKTLARLSHPNIVSVIDAVEQDGEPWLVMEFVPGRDLARLVAEDGPLTPRHAARIGAQIAAALAYAHAQPQPVVHRDITPRNILITDDDVAKLTDFGIARVGEETIVGAPVQGVPEYYAPEAANNRRRPGPRSDVFSLGAVLYAAVEGRSPWGTGSESEILERAENGVVLPPVKAGRPLSGALMRMLRKLPSTRPRAAQAERALRRVAEPDPSWRVAGTAVAVCIVLFAVVVAWRGAGATPARVGLGDQRTADPCALIRTEPFDRFGSTTLEPDYGSFNRCDVLIDAPAGSQHACSSSRQPSRPRTAWSSRTTRSPSTARRAWTTGAPA